jgi:hypothetical protein
MCIDTRLDTPLMQLSDTELGQLVRKAMRSISNHHTGDVLMIACNSMFCLTEHVLGWQLTVDTFLPMNEDVGDDDATIDTGPQTNTGTASCNRIS